MSTADETTSRVSQQSGKSMPTVCQTRRNPRSTPSSQTAGRILSEHGFVHTRPLTETVPRLRRDCSETNDRPLEDSIFRIRPEMSDQETQPRTRSEEMPDPLLTLKETADYLRLTPAALYTQRHRGDKPGVLGIRVGRKILFRPADINSYLDELLAETQISHHQ